MERKQAVCGETYLCGKVTKITFCSIIYIQQIVNDCHTWQVLGQVLGNYSEQNRPTVTNPCSCGVRFLEEETDKNKSHVK